MGTWSPLPPAPRLQKKKAALSAAFVCAFILSFAPPAPRRFDTLDTYFVLYSGRCKQRYDVRVAHIGYIAMTRFIEDTLDVLTFRKVHIQSASVAHIYASE